VKAGVLVHLLCLMYLWTALGLLPIYRILMSPVAGLIPDSVTGIFHGHNPSSRTMALGLTQPLTEMSTADIYWGVKAAGA
jgi:hypothetical protein